ncbi:BTB/POZ domain-containing protein, partial [Serratia marcescens]|uniref:BTB/POZ domain-containing protein n=1 Tax=Serratia marcescens TaxID=615 RepID=UPI0013D8E12F
TFWSSIALAMGSGDSFKLAKLRKLCLNFIARNHKELVKQGSLNQLSPSVLIEIMDYLSILE